MIFSSLMRRRSASRLFTAALMHTPLMLLSQGPGSMFYPLSGTSVSADWLAPDGAGGAYAQWKAYAEPRMLIHLAPNGSMDWARRFENDGGSAGIFMDKAVASNGDLIGGLGNSAYGGGLGDSGYVAVSLSRVQPDGDLTWTTYARTHFWTAPYGSWYGDIALGQDDAVFVAVGVEDDRNVLFKFSSAGELLWARWIRPDLSAQTTHVTSDGGDGCFVVCQPSGISQFFNIIHLNGEGDQVGAYRYTEVAPAAYLKIMEAGVIDNGDLILAGSNALPGIASYFMALRIGADGLPIWTRYYSKPGMTPISWEDYDDLAFAGEDIWFHDQASLLRIAEDGDGIDAFERATMVSGGIQTSWSIGSLAASSDTVRVCGEMTTLDLTLGFAETWTFSSALVPNEFPCYLQQMALTTIDATGAFDVEPISSVVDPRYASGSVGGGQAIEVAPWGGLDLCAWVGVAEVEATPSPWIAPSVLASGETLRVRVDHGTSIRVVNSAGQSVLDQKPSGSSDEMVVGTAGLAPGVYAVIAIGRGDQLLASTRLIVY